MAIAQEARVTYFKRFRMEIDLQGALANPELPSGYAFIAWSEVLLEAHADTKFRCFHDQLDAVVFPSLGSRDGCMYLMREIRRKPGFRPEATWLLNSPEGYVGTVQGIRERTGTGSIQNLGIVAGQRGRGLGSALLLQALHGFRRYGYHRAFLEVTAQNEGALRLYRRLGFRCRKTIYKTVGANTFAVIDAAHEFAGDWVV
jgi:ribosomal protein S18 acetylase RimI-like enzyme